ncbi:MAG: hypothetical protein FWD61_17940 [Phycisphaerales bacterium]|nr:hypothetical protein [Phycisphaerales bacterium]
MKVCKNSVFLAIISALVAYSVILAAQAEAPATQPAMKSPDAVAAMKAYSEATAKAQAEYDRAVNAAKVKATEALEAAMAKATKAGNLDEAIAIRENLKHVKPDPTPEDKRKAEIALAKQLLGTWDMTCPTDSSWRAKMEFRADGTFYMKSTITISEGTWRIADNQIRLMKKNNDIWSAELDDGKLNLINSKHVAYVGTRSTGQSR